MTSSDSNQRTTIALARFAIAPVNLPAKVESAGIRSFVNILGCTFGGLSHPARQTAEKVALEFVGAPTTTLIGVAKSVDALTGAYLNCLASAAHAFDDTHLPTVIHPAGPVASALFSLAERTPISGREFLEAFIVGVEIECRLGAALLLPPAQGQLGWYATGVTGGVAAAAACARVLGLSEERTCWALSIAANQASGFRQTHGSMCVSFVPAHAARCGLESAILAAAGFSGSDAALEGSSGYFDVFSLKANPATAVAGLGECWEICDNAFKPYPCGIVIHPVIDACVALTTRAGWQPDEVRRVVLDVDSLCLRLCDRPRPTDSQLAQVSVQHWAAAALVRGRAGLAEGSEDCVHDHSVQSMRERVETQVNDKVGRDGALVMIEFNDGTTCEQRIEHCVGSQQNPMSNDALGEKFLAQVEPVIGSGSAQRLLEDAWAVASLERFDNVLARCIAH